MGVKGKQLEKCKALKDLGAIKFKVDEGTEEDEDVPFLPPGNTKKAFGKNERRKRTKSKKCKQKNYYFV